MGGEYGDNNTNFIRLLRLAKAVRALRVIRVMHLFGKLRILVRTVAMSMMSLFWSMVLLFILMFIGAVLLCRMLNPFLFDESLDFSMRVWIFENYGTPTLSLYTFFEATFSGCFPNYFRPLVYDVHSAFAIFVAVYVITVVFAVTRIITALFLKDTLQVAAADAEMVMRERVLQRNKYIQRLNDLFTAADTSGDGKISLEEFKDLMEQPQVMTWFQLLDLEVHEVVSLFNLLDDGDGFVTHDEFLNGVMRLKGHARALDIVAISKDLQCVMDQQTAHADQLNHIEEINSKLLLLVQCPPRHWFQQQCGEVKPTRSIATAADVYSSM